MGSVRGHKLRIIQCRWYMLVPTAPLKEGGCKWRIDKSLNHGRGGSKLIGQKRFHCLRRAGTQDGNGPGRISKTKYGLALLHPDQICICHKITDTEYFLLTQSNWKIHKLRLRGRKCDHRGETRCQKIAERDFCLGRIRTVDKSSPNKGQMSRLKLRHPGRGGADDTVPELPATLMDWLALALSPSICMFCPC